MNQKNLLASPDRVGSNVQIMARTEKKKTLTIAGGSGVIGRHLISAAKKKGWKVNLLTRTARETVKDNVTYFTWNPSVAAENDRFEVENIRLAVDGSDYLINLAGRSIVESRWSDVVKKEIIGSRLNAVRALGQTLKVCQKPPQVWLQGSATGFYGESGDDPVNESATVGSLFLSDVCRRIEQEFASWTSVVPKTSGIVGRIGLVLAKDAPAWKKILSPVKIGAGGRIGSGKQWYPWIDADDLAEAMLFLCEKKKKGVYNLSAPEPVRQRDLVKAIASHLHKPSFLPAPVPVLNMMLGRQVVNELLLTSCRSLPQRLLGDKFQFTFSTIDKELVKLLS